MRYVRTCLFIFLRDIDRHNGRDSDSDRNRRRQTETDRDRQTHIKTGTETGTGDVALIQWIRSSMINED